MLFLAGCIREGLAPALSTLPAMPSPTGSRGKRSQPEDALSQDSRAALAIKPFPMPAWPGAGSAAGWQLPWRSMDSARLQRIRCCSWCVLKLIPYPRHATLPAVTASPLSASRPLAEAYIPLYQPLWLRDKIHDVSCVCRGFPDSLLFFLLPPEVWKREERSTIC